MVKKLFSMVEWNFDNGGCTDTIYGIAFKKHAYFIYAHRHNTIFIIYYKVQIIFSLRSSCLQGMTQDG